MLPEFSIIKAFLTFTTWQTYNSYITSKDMPEEAQFLYRVLDGFHKTNEAGDNLELQDLANLFFSQYTKDGEFYDGVFNTLADYEPHPEGVRQLITSLKRNRQLRELSLVAYEAAEGKKPYTDVEKLLEGLSSTEEVSDTEDDDLFVSDNLEEILDSTYRTPGYRWRLHTLNKSLGSLRLGDFGFVFARPEVGKTTFLCSEIPFMAQQLEDGDCVLYVNNEEQSTKVKGRLIQGTLGITTEQMMSNTAKWNQQFNEIIGGRILMPKRHVTRKEEVEHLCKVHKPKLIIIDTIDNITGFKADREDLVLGAIYKWARWLASQYGPVIGVCHADGQAEGVKWLNMVHVANAKTEKQKHADFIIGIGKTHDAGYENVRYLGISKNKLTGDAGVTEEQFRHGRMECLIDAIHARYLDI